MPLGAISYHWVPFWLAGYHLVKFGTIGYHWLPLGTILVGRVRFWKGLVSFKSARRLMVTELVSDITVTRDAYASKNTISWLLDNVSALGERGSFDVHLIGKSTFFILFSLA